MKSYRKKVFDLVNLLNMQNLLNIIHYESYFFDVGNRQLLNSNWN